MTADNEADGEAEDVDRFNSATEVPGLTRAEKKTISDHSRPNAALVHETIRADGRGELDRTWWSLLISAIAAGLSISFSLVVQGSLQARLPDTPWRELVVGLGYPVGFLIVVLGRQQLFTENTLTPILELLYCRNLKTLKQVGPPMGSHPDRKHRRDVRGGGDVGPCARTATGDQNGDG